MGRIEIPDFRFIAAVIAILGWCTIELLLWVFSFFTISFSG